MGAVTLELEAGKFANLSGRVEVFNAEGKLLGTFSPQVPKPLYADLEIPFSEEEIRRRIEEARTEPGYTTAEVLTYLKSLGSN